MATDKHFFHGGDLRGLTQRLDYIEALGATAIWLGPIFTNKRVQGAPGEQTAGYHGYWITDFTQVDPHFGTRQELKTFVDAAHARGMKVYLDIITNHTADVIAYRECAAGPCPYRSRADSPYTRRGGLGGEPINAGFQGDSVHTAGNFANLTRSDFAYTPHVPPAEAELEVPGWLNDPIWYHNRGNTTFLGENSVHGDFVGLGWQPAVGNNLIGAARDIHTYNDLAGESLAIIGTDRKLYTYYNNNFYDITPLSTTVPAVFTFTSATTIVNVLATSNGAIAGDFVTFSGVSGVNVVNITNADMGQEFEIQNIVDSNNFTIDVASIATPGVVTTSGTASGAAFQINVGADITTVGNGWGAGAWGFSTWNTPRPNKELKLTKPGQLRSFAA